MCCRYADDDVCFVDRAMAEVAKRRMTELNNGVLCGVVWWWGYCFDMLAP
ncbi:hypothetical protein CGRA01v4_09786 [Colletotrichum graminicola]|nr:hypothetical protein CGRA01v4_09786 [Colletotrichum graminicola]